jgi:hypothetical protein
MRASRVRDVLIYCRDHRCGHHIETNAVDWPDDVRLSDVKPNTSPAPGAASAVRTCNRSFRRHARGPAKPLACAGAAGPVSEPRAPGALHGLPTAHAAGPLAVVGANKLLLFLLSGGGGAVARVSSLVTSCAPLLPSFCASGAAFLAAFCSPGSPFLTALCPRLDRIGGRRRGRGGRSGGGLGFRW